MYIIENIKKQKIFESLDESFIIQNIKITFKLFINTFLIKNHYILYNIMINLKWSFYDKKNIIILYFQSYNDLNILLYIKTQLLKLLQINFNNPYMNIIYSLNQYKQNNNNFFMLSQTNYNIIYLKEKLCLKQIESFN